MSTSSSSFSSAAASATAPAKKKTIEKRAAPQKEISKSNTRAKQTLPLSKAIESGKTTLEAPLAAPFRAVSLFSGIGGIEAGLGDWCHVTKCVEINSACHAILRKQFSGVEIENDVRRVARLENVDLLCGGFPCQDISQAGKGTGLKGKRSGLVHEIFRILEHSTPPIPLVFLENVQMLRVRGLDVILQEFARLGYDVRWCTVEAMMLGALHRRKRIFILATKSGIENNLAPLPPRLPSANANIWATEPGVARVLDESTPKNQSRLRMLGNAVMPQMAEHAFSFLYNDARNAKNDANNGASLTGAQSSSSSSTTAEKQLPNNGFFSCASSSVVEIDFQGRADIARIVFPATIQRFKTTHSIPTPTATDHILLRPTNTLLNRAFRPGVNKSVSLNRYVQMFPDRSAAIPPLDKDGALLQPLQFSHHLNPAWVEWLMGFEQGWTEI